MISIRTGLPGHGKSLFAVSEIEKLRQQTGRDVYYNGIPELKLPWIELSDAEVERWWECPDGAIILVDEAQRFFRPRGNGSQVPEKVQRFEVHRKAGHDVYLITQDGSFLDQNIRKLCDTHVHVFRGWGFQEATRYEWQEYQNVRSAAARKSCTIKSTVKYPKEVYGWYKSANLHTVRVRLPVKLLSFVAVLLCVILYSAYSFVSSWFADRGKIPGASSTSASSGQAQPVGGGSNVQARVYSAQELAQQLTPVVRSIPGSAPLYQSEWLKVASVPVIQGCVSSADECVCYTDQATRVDVDPAFCRSMVLRPVFDHTRARAPVQALASPVQPAVADVSPGDRSARPHARERERVMLPARSPGA